MIFINFHPTEQDDIAAKMAQTAIWCEDAGNKPESARAQRFLTPQALKDRDSILAPEQPFFGVVLDLRDPLYPISRKKPAAPALEDLTIAITANEFDASVRLGRRVTQSKVPDQRQVF
jgi:hypothetical protein